MKTAISIPDKIFFRAEELAKRLQLSRSELYVRAIELFLQRQYDETITQRLNEVYGELDSSLDPVLAQMQAASFHKEIYQQDW